MTASITGYPNASNSARMRKVLGPRNDDTYVMTSTGRRTRSGNLVVIEVRPDMGTVAEAERDAKADVSSIDRH